MHLATYGFPDARITVAFEADGFAGWLDEVLRPGFVPLPPASDAVTVVVRSAPDAEPPGIGGEAIGRVPCFVFDHDIVSHDAWRVGEGIEVLDRKYGARYVIGPETVEVQLHEPLPATRAAVLRVVRELTFAQTLAQNGHLLLHASGVERDGNVALFAGAKEAGKTTLAARLASVAPAAIVSNDCALASRAETDAPRWDAHAVPIPVSVRAGTVKRLPHLFETVPAIDRPSRLTMAESDQALARHGTVRTEERLRLSPPQFACAAQTVLSAGGNLASLAFVRVDESVRGFELHRLDVSEAEARIATVIYGPRGSESGYTVFEQFLGTHRPPTADARTGTRMAAEIPIVDLRVGRTVLEDDDVARDLLSTLLNPT